MDEYESPSYSAYALRQEFIREYNEVTAAMSALAASIDGMRIVGPFVYPATDEEQAAYDASMERYMALKRRGNDLYYQINRLPSFADELGDGLDEHDEIPF